MTNSVKFTLSRYLPAVVLFCSSAWAADAASRVEVAFDHPEKFKDVRESSMQSDKDRDHLLGQIQSYVEEQAQRLVAVLEKIGGLHLGMTTDGSTTKVHNNLIVGKRVGIGRILNDD